MKKILFSAAILIAALVFTSCDDPKNGGDYTINAKVSNGDLVNDQVDEVRAVGGIRVAATPPDWWDDWWGTYYEWQEIVIAEALFKNGGFKLKLPKDIDERLLEEMFDYFDLDEYELPKGITISNKNAKGTIVEEIEAYKKNSFVGYFYYFYGNPNTEAYVMYVFVDSDCKISGTYSETYTSDWSGTTYKEEYTADLNLKKGWNAVYSSYTEVGNTDIFKASTKKPNFDLAWYFDGGYGGYYAPEKNVKKHQKPSMFLRKDRR